MKHVGMQNLPENLPENLPNIPPLPHLGIQPIQLLLRTGHRSAGGRHAAPHALARRRHRQRLCRYGDLIWQGMGEMEREAEAGLLNWSSNRLFRGAAALHANAERGDAVSVEEYTGGGKARGTLRACRRPSWHCSRWLRPKEKARCSLSECSSNGN